VRKHFIRKKYSSRLTLISGLKTASIFLRIFLDIKLKNSVEIITLIGHLHQIQTFSGLIPDEKDFDLGLSFDPIDQPIALQIRGFPGNHRDFRSIIFCDFVYCSLGPRALMVRKTYAWTDGDVMLI